jgi:hypothetical protein
MALLRSGITSKLTQIIVQQFANAFKEAAVCLLSSDLGIIRAAYGKSC